jgi:hypothetical protein
VSRNDASMMGICGFLLGGKTAPGTHEARATK